MLTYRQIRLCIACEVHMEVLQLCHASTSCKHGTHVCPPSPSNALVSNRHCTRKMHPGFVNSSVNIEFAGIKHHVIMTCSPLQSRDSRHIRCPVHSCLLHQPNLLNFSFVHVSHFVSSRVTFCVSRANYVVFSSYE